MYTHAPIHYDHAGVALDQVGYTTTPNRPVIVAESKPSENMMIDTVAHAAKKYTNLGVLVNHNPFGSDHMSYLNQGLPSILLIEREDESYPGMCTSKKRV